jgi:hypothetical protein
MGDPGRIGGDMRAVKRPVEVTRADDEGQRPGGMRRAQEDEGGNQSWKGGPGEEDRGAGGRGRRRWVQEHWRDDEGIDGEPGTPREASGWSGGHGGRIGEITTH